MVVVTTRFVFDVRHDINVRYDINGLHGRPEEPRVGRRRISIITIIIISTSAPPTVAPTVGPFSCRRWAAAADIDVVQSQSRRGAGIVRGREKVRDGGVGHDVP